MTWAAAFFPLAPPEPITTTPTRAHEAPFSPSTSTLFHFPFVLVTAFSRKRLSINTAKKYFQPILDPKKAQILPNRFSATSLRQANSARPLPLYSVWEKTPSFVNPQTRADRISQSEALTQGIQASTNVLWARQQGFEPTPPPFGACRLLRNAPFRQRPAARAPAPGPRVVVAANALRSCADCRRALQSPRNAQSH